MHSSIRINAAQDDAARICQTRRNTDASCCRDSVRNDSAMSSDLQQRSALNFANPSTSCQSRMMGVVSMDMHFVHNDAAWTKAKFSLSKGK